MAYLASTLVTYAWYESGIVARGLETVTGEQATDGLRLLNELLSEKSLDIREIPYYTDYQFNATIGTEMYFVPNLVQPDILTYILNTVRYSMRPTQRQFYQGSDRVLGVKTLPGIWEYEKIVGGCNVYIYFLPDLAYPFTLWGKFDLSQVSSNTDLDTLVDPYYSSYLKYALANKLCGYYNYPTSAHIGEKIQYLSTRIKTLSRKDYTPTYYSTMSKDTYINYAQVNIGKGWVPL